jgi:hypothetical protein
VPQVHGRFAAVEQLIVLETATGPLDSQLNSMLVRSLIDEYEVMLSGGEG